jgi:ADP-heptose:LPS heptosyltransferase
MNRTGHILVIRLSAMGDVAMTVPVIRALLKQHPRLKITVLTRGFFTPVFKTLPGVEVFSADLKGRHKGPRGLFILAKELRRLKIDAVADLHNVLRTKILKVFLTGIPFYQIDKGRSEKKALTSGKCFKQLKTTHQRYADVFEKLGFAVNLKHPGFPEKAPLDLTRIIAGIDPEKKLIGIAPFAAHRAKMYPLRLMTGLIEELCKHYQILLFGGGPEEVAQLNRIQKPYADVYSVAGDLSFEQELDLISNLDLMIARDSGNGHLAAIYGVKVLSIWGVTHPYAGFTPFNQPIEHSLMANRQQYPLIPTSIYGNKYPEAYEEAAGSISVSDILTKVKELLA